MNRTASALVLALLAAPALAQNHQPYAGLQHRPVKALSDQQIEDLRAGRGMGLALAAELNGYPGPTHVLEHADALRLTADQRQRTEALLAAMRQEAIALGDRLLEQEAELDRLFASREITPERLGTLTEEIALTQATLRQTHLKYHLSMMDVLSPDQVARYGELRGYGAAHSAGQGHSGHK
jgi:Spy/CpxP family protein refolding chaperone